MDKQDLQQLLAAADADKCLLQQQLAEQAHQHAAAHEKLLAELQHQQHLLASATEREQAAAAQATAAEAQAAAAKLEQQERQQQQAQQLLMQASVGQQHELEQVLQRLQWLCSAYLSPATTQAYGSTSQAVEAANNGSNAAAALRKLHAVCCLAGSDADELLSARYETYQQHKLEVTQGLHRASPGCDSGSGPNDVTVQLQASAGMDCVQQQLLQLEAGLLQHMLNLQEAVQLLRQQQEQEQQQHLQQRVPNGQRPSTASSRYSESCSTAASCCSNGSRGRSCDLTGQLLQAMAKDRKQLAQEVKRLQAQQHQQQHSQQRYLRSSSSSSYDVDHHPAFFRTENTGCSAVPKDSASNEANDREVDEVLQLLQGYEVQSCQQEKRTPAKVNAAGTPPRELQRRGIGSLKSRMLV